MPPNATKFRWDGRRERAAVLLAEDELSDQKIADEIGVNKKTLELWKRSPEFATRIVEHVKALEAEALKFAIAKKRKRVAALQDRWDRMQQVIVERGANEDLGVYRFERDPETQEITGTHIVPGWSTGLLVRKETQNTLEFKVDTGLLAELRDHEKQAAQELGQWIEKAEQSGPNGGPIQLTTRYIEMSDEELDGRIAELESQRATGISPTAGGETAPPD